MHEMLPTREILQTWRWCEEARFYWSRLSGYKVFVGPSGFGTRFSLGTSVLPCQHHYTNAPQPCFIL